MSKQFDEKFKENASRYYFEHKELGLKGCAEKLGVNRTALGVWTKEAKGKNGEVPSRSSGNYESDEAKENARLRRELSDAQNALDILKKAISEKTVGNCMREMGIKLQYVKPYIKTTVDSNFSEELKNILVEQFNPEHPNEAWHSDITHIGTFEVFAYLTNIMNLYSRKIIA